MQIKSYCLHGWPEKHQLKGAIKPFIQFASELSVQDGLLLKGTRIVIPTTMRLEILDRIPEGHLGIVKCRQRALSSVWWPGLSKQIEELVKLCATCNRYKPDHSETMIIPEETPSRGFEKVAADLCELNKKIYLVIVDYYSRFFELELLSSTTSKAVIAHMKSVFARHGVPSKVFSDGGPQFSSGEFAKFSRDWQFEHITSSPNYPQSNGAVEKAVQTAKNILKKEQYHYLGLLAYRATPIHNGYSPAELLMSRKLRTTLPSIPANLQPSINSLPKVKEAERIYKQKQAIHYNHRHRARDLPPLSEHESVWIKDRKEYGEIIKTAETPRSYMVKTPSNKSVRRNRRHLVSTSPVKQPPTEDPADTNNKSQSVPEEGYHTRSGRLSIPPKRLGVDDQI